MPTSEEATEILDQQTREAFLGRRGAIEIDYIGPKAVIFDRFGDNPLDSVPVHTAGATHAPQPKREDLRLRKVFEGR
ncbi:MAG: hypothetical protein JWN64_38 [Parcubacteria group bacterium]|nr:hypothetical protein [Parcubacteria group bacterium]